MSIAQSRVYRKGYAIDDLDVSILDVIKKMQIGDFNSDFADDILQYLRVKILSYDKGNDLEKDARFVLTRSHAFSVCCHME